MRECKWKNKIKKIIVTVIMSGMLLASIETSSDAEVLLCGESKMEWVEELL